MNKFFCSKCEVCGKVQSKYKCPRCHKRTCSLTCVKQHKEETSCNGVRDKTAFVKMKEMGDMHLLSGMIYREGLISLLPNQFIV